MPKFKLPKPKASKQDDAPQAVGSPVEWRRRLTIPANDAILASADIDDEVTVTLKAKVIGLRNVESKDHNDQNIEVEITEISVYPTDDDAEQERGMKHGYEG